MIARRSDDGTKMDLQSFRRSVAAHEPPGGLSRALKALWWDAKGDWEKAHEHAQRRDDEDGMRVHAYLHRKEGDQSNAAYWYHRCRLSPSTVSLDMEWQSLVEEFLLKA